MIAEDRDDGSTMAGLSSWDKKSSRLDGEVLDNEITSMFEDEVAAEDIDDMYILDDDSEVNLCIVCSNYFVNHITFETLKKFANEWIELAGEEICKERLVRWEGLWYSSIDGGLLAIRLLAMVDRGVVPPSVLPVLSV